MPRAEAKLSWSEICGSGEIDTIMGALGRKSANEQNEWRDWRRGNRAFAIEALDKAITTGISPKCQENTRLSIGIMLLPDYPKGSKGDHERSRPPTKIMVPEIGVSVDLAKIEILKYCRPFDALCCRQWRWPTDRDTIVLAFTYRHLHGREECT